MAVLWEAMQELGFTIRISISLSIIMKIKIGYRNLQREKLMLSRFLSELNARQNKLFICSELYESLKRYQVH